MGSSLSCCWGQGSQDALLSSRTIELLCRMGWDGVVGKFWHDLLSAVGDHCSGGSPLGRWAAYQCCHVVRDCIVYHSLCIVFIIIIVTGFMVGCSVLVLVLDLVSPFCCSVKLFLCQPTRFLS